MYHRHKPIDVIYTKFSVVEVKRPNCKTVFSVARSGKLLVSLTNRFILGSESSRTNGHILLSKCGSHVHVMEFICRHHFFTTLCRVVAVAASRSESGQRMHSPVWKVLLFWIISICRVWGSLSGGCQEFCLLEYTAVQFGKNQPTFRRSIRLHLHARWVCQHEADSSLIPCLAYSSTLKMKVLCCSETSVHFRPTTWHCISEESISE
jgi:hypothetical protein